MRTTAHSIDSDPFRFRMDESFFPFLPGDKPEITHSVKQKCRNGRRERTKKTQRGNQNSFTTTLVEHGSTPVLTRNQWIRGRNRCRKLSVFSPPFCRSAE